MTLRLLEFKMEIDLEIKNAKNSLIALKDYRMRISSIIDKINELSEYYELGLDKKKEEKSTKSTPILLSLLTILLI